MGSLMGTCWRGFVVGIVVGIGVAVAAGADGNCSTDTAGRTTLLQNVVSGRAAAKTPLAWLRDSRRLVERW